MKRMLVTSAALAALMLAVPATPARAQEKGTELGVGMLTWVETTCSGCSSTSTVMTGGGYVLAGFYLSPMIALEPRLTVASASGGGETATVWGIALGVPIYFSKTYGHNGWFVEPGVSYTTETCSGCSSANQTSGDVELGYKVHLNTNAAMRIGAFYEIGLSASNSTKTDSYGIEFGLSAFLK